MFFSMSFVYFFASWTCFAVLFASFWRFVRFVSSQNDPLKDFSSSGDLQSIFGRLLVDCFLLIIFFAQHSLMATDSWKNFISKRIFLHRSLYIVSTAVSLQILTYFWCDVSEIYIWRLDSSLWFFWAIHFFCWVTLYGMSILTDLAELVGLKQAYYLNADLGNPLDYKSQELRSVYAHMRHPSFSCFCILFFFRPFMTLDRFLFAVSFVVYMILYFRVDRNDFVYQKRQCKLKWDELWRPM